MTDFVCLYVLWVICCLPILTIGPSTCAFYYAYNRCILQDEPLWKSFWKSFRLNFKQALGIGLIRSVLWIVLGINCYLAYQLSGFLIGKAIMWAIFLMSLVILTWSEYWLPYVSQYDDKTKTVFRNCGIIMIRDYTKTFAIMALTVFLGVLLYVLFPMGVFGLPALYMALCGNILCKVLGKYVTRAADYEEAAEQTEDTE